MFKNFKKQFKIFYFHKLRGFRPLTVILRHSITPEQESFLHTHKFFLQLENFKNWFSQNKDKKIFLEIGFGAGEHLLSLGQDLKENKNTKILGIELYKPGVLKALRKIDEEKLENIFVSTRDARDVLKKISNKSLGRIYILFPDPWTKKRQFSRRLLNQNFLNKCLRKIRQDGEIIIATDWANYAEEIEKDLINLKNKINFQKFENHEVVAEKAFQNICNTNFARRAKAEGRGITIFILKKNLSSHFSLRFKMFTKRNFLSFTS